MVQTTSAVIVSPPARSALATIVANTMLASPRGPNHPMKNLLSLLRPEPATDKTIESTRTRVRLKIE